MKRSVSNLRYGKAVRVANGDRDWGSKTVSKQRF